MGGNFSFQNSLLAGNRVNTNFDVNAFGLCLDLGHNLSSDATPALSGPASRNNVDPLLGPLDDYGGSTLSMALLAGSPAIDTADPTACPATDQRGRPRPSGAGCDIGAFESSPPYLVRGSIGGYTAPPGGITVLAYEVSVTPDAAGQFDFSGLSAGGWEIRPVAADVVFVPTHEFVTVGPDVVGLHFQAYRSNALTIERISGPTLRAVLAGRAGDLWVILESADLLNWTPCETNTIGGNGICQVLPSYPIVTPRFFRALKP